MKTATPRRRASTRRPTDTANPASPASILVVDIGGTKVKVLATGQSEPRKAPSGKKFTPARMVEVVRELATDWEYEAVSVGYPEADVLDRARAAGVLAYLDKPLSRAELGAAVVLAWEQFRQLQALRQEVEELRQSLAERKLIERAKEAVAHRLGVIEGEAFVRMRKYASDRNLKLAEAAQAVLDAERIR